MGRFSNLMIYLRPAISRPIDPRTDAMVAARSKEFVETHKHQLQVSRCIPQKLNKNTTCILSVVLVAVLVLA